MSRTTGYNSVRTLMAKLSYFNAVSGDLLSCLPLQLIIRGKSTTQSYRTPIYYVDLTLQEGVSLKEAVENAQAIFQKQQKSGFDQQALEAIAKQGYANSDFEIQAEEGGKIVEEFYRSDQPSVQMHSANEIRSLEKGLQ